MAPLIVFISGASTEIGKTWVAARLIEKLRAAGIAVHARKPVQSFDPSDELTDADVLAAATGESPEQVTPKHRCYEVAMAPPMAAEVLERPEIQLQELISETRIPEEGVVIVEGVGGPRSPLAHNGDSVSLARALQSDLVVVVASADLGAVNAVMLSTSAFSPRRTIVLLNRFDEDNDLHVRTRGWLIERHERNVVTSVEELVPVVARMQAERASAVG